MNDKRLTNQNLLIFETPYWEVFLSEEQNYLGRSVIVLKRGCGDLAELNTQEALDFFEIVKKLEDLFRRVFNATMFNWTCLMNHAYLVTPPRPQVHWHFRPRYDHEVEFSGYVFKDPNFGKHYLKGAGGEDEKIIPLELQMKLVEELRKNL
jgi:diadenosine tetraphosphate (Ap4A) HIT family hydrolase